MSSVSNYLELKKCLGTMAQTQQSRAATVGLLAFSGLSSLQTMPEMCYLLQSLYGLVSCGFFWSEETGEMVDAWCLAPSFLSFKTLVSCREYQESATRSWPTFEENVLRGPVAGYLLPFQNERFYASPHYLVSYGPINARYIMDVVLHDGTRPYGAFLMMRSKEQGPFTPDERTELQNLIPILTAAFVQPPSGKTQYAEREIAGAALASADGSYKSLSEEARRIIWMITHEEPGSFANPEDPSIESHFEQLVARDRGQWQQNPSCEVERQNRWGQFRIKYEQEPQTGDLVVMVSRKLPLVSRLAMQVAHFNWSPMRQIVAVLLAQDFSRKEIADTLGLSVETVTSHIKRIYKETDSASSHTLLFRLIA